MAEENRPAKPLKLDEYQNASTSSAEPKPPMLKIDADCLGEIFDYLSLRDLCSIGQTCKLLHQVAGQHFNLNYPLDDVYICESNGKITEKVYDNGSNTSTNFGQHAQKIAIDRYDHRSIAIIWNYLAKKLNQNQRCIEFHNISDWADEVLCIKPILKNIQALSFVDCNSMFHQKFLDSMLQDCCNLRCLTLHRENGGHLNCSWRLHHIPSLESVEMINIDSNDVRTFLRANPQIKKLKINIEDAERVIEEIDLALDVLALEIDAVQECDDTVYRQLIALKRRGKFKELQARMHSFEDVEDNINYLNHIKNLNCVNSLSFACGAGTKLASLTHLTELCIFVRESSIDCFDLLSKSLINLEVLRLHGGRFEDTIPFARRLPKLRLIEADRKNSDTKFNIISLNSDRKKLGEVWKLIIYLGHDAFMKVRWESIDLQCELVEIRRATKPCACDKCF